MLFHITAQHDHTTCGFVTHGKETLKSRGVWVEGNDKVKVLGAWGYQTSHTLFGIVEADAYEDIAEHFEYHLGLGPVEVLPIMDMVQRRRDLGFWGQS
jgi:hypothetical protein|tara:strand:+ start:26 stop:319 length:294 start_codon:yes stop_codon:yes gene_type:complete